MRSFYSLFVLLFTITTLTAQPSTITYQGKLLDDNGNPVTHTGISMEFRIYHALSGGNLIWGPETKSVNVQDGLYSVYLGESDIFTAADFAATVNRFLQVKCRYHSCPS